MNARNRRKGMLWLLLVLILSAGSLPSWAAQARNVILMIGDGMGPAHVQLAWLYATRQLNRPLVMTEVMDAG
jgi:alkaline phosphatase